MQIHTNYEMSKIALVKYLDNDFRVLRSGHIVRCAITDQPIPLHSLTYWSAQKQEAYIDAAAAFKAASDVN